MFQIQLSRLQPKKYCLVHSRRLVPKWQIPVLRHFGSWLISGLLGTYSRVTDAYILTECRYHIAPMQFLIEYVTQSYHKIKMTLKRTVTVDAPRPTKKPRTLARRVDRLSRQVARSLPELRQETFVITIPAGSNVPQALIGTRVLQGNGTQEIRLHRIRVAWTSFSDGQPWATMYSPVTNTTSISAHGLYDPAVANNAVNFYVPIDRTNSAVYVSKNFFLENQVNLPSMQNFPMTIDHRFSTPKRIRFAEEGTTSTPLDQIFYIGGARSNTNARDIYVTLWYTS